MLLTGLRNGDIIARQSDGYPLHVIAAPIRGNVVGVWWTDHDGEHRVAMLGPEQVRPWRERCEVGAFIPPVRVVARRSRCYCDSDFHPEGH